MLWGEQLLPMYYRYVKKGGVLFWFGLVSFERRARSVHEYFIGWRKREVEVLAAHALRGSYMSLLS